MIRVIKMISVMIEIIKMISVMIKNDKNDIIND